MTTGPKSTSDDPSESPESTTKPATKLETLPNIFTRRSPDESPYRESSVRPGKAAADRGRNLSQRWVQIERTFRAKRELVEEKEEIEEETSENLAQAKVGGVKEKGRENVEMFKGFIIPKKPNPPADDECCMSGCAICVYDLYEDSLESYYEGVQAIQSKLRALGVPDPEWPESIRPKYSGNSTEASGRGSGKSQVLSAFEELERKLAAKG
ncbi:hypothetical protein FA13DRAFT_1837911 [Coprinellus micaceus]|uniref:Oxidoreductase-like domain-containing protein n=1 Tax=Coprinellus micaceus TaxID=71717 RepID=A0A4Y7TGS4_COPMI|nr:hypothetical protein FA13DRAFT_1837911 [Coprinellus micaceus]